MAKVDIIVVTFSAYEMCRRHISALFANTDYRDYRVILVNNGPKGIEDMYDKGHPRLTIVHTGENLGWEGGIHEGLKYSDSEFVVFSNDDLFIPQASSGWLGRFLELFQRDPLVAAVGPASNVVMGMQNMFVDCDFRIIEPTLLIGFFLMLRRSALNQVGGMNMDFRGGDDLDLSIRLRKAGYKLVARRDIFVFHHGFVTGNAVHGDHTKLEGWNSRNMTEKTNMHLIRKHGFKVWLETLWQSYKPYQFPEAKLELPKVQPGVLGLV